MCKWSHPKRTGLVTAALIPVDPCNLHWRTSQLGWDQHMRTNCQWVDQHMTSSDQQPNIAVTLADVIEDFMVAHPPRNGIQWPALRAHLETQLLGDQFERVLRQDNNIVPTRSRESYSIVKDLSLPRRTHIRNHGRSYCSEESGTGERTKHQSTPLTRRWGTTTSRQWLPLRKRKVT